MDHKTSYAFHIAQAIRHKKAMKADILPDADGDIPDTESEELPDIEADTPDPKAARKERLKAILAR